MNRKSMIALILGIVAVMIVTGVLLALHHPAFGPHPFRRTNNSFTFSPHYRDGRFRNEHPTQQFTGQRSSGMAAMWNFLTDRTNERVPEKSVEIEKINLTTLPADEDWLVWFGHSSYLFCLNGQKVLVDPVLKLEFPASWMLKPFPETDIYTPEDMPDIDWLVITHEHWDHMDYATLRDLRTKVRNVICPLGISEYLRYWGYEASIIHEMDWGENFGEDVKWHCLPTRHFSNRLFGANQTLWASFLIDCGGKKIYIGGDGGYDDRFSRIQKQFGTIDLAIMENGQYNPNWAYIHMLPADLEKAMEDLKAKSYFTVHHDKFSLAPHAWNEPDELVLRMKEKHPDWQILDQPVGNIIRL